MYTAINVHFLNQRALEWMISRHIKRSSLHKSTMNQSAMIVLQIYLASALHKVQISNQSFKGSMQAKLYVKAIGKKVLAGSRQKKEI